MEWQTTIDANRLGAGYFLSQRGRLHFDPSEYIAFRALEKSRSSQLLLEWARWMQDLQNSSHEFVCQKAKAAPRMTNKDIDNYYKDRIVANHELDILEISSNQVVEGGRNLTSLLQKCEVPPRDTSATLKGSIAAAPLQKVAESSTEITLPASLHAPAHEAEFNNITAEYQTVQKDDSYLDMPSQKKPRICSSPSPLHGASSVSSRHTPPYFGGSVASSPELPMISPPSPPDFTLDGKTMEQEANSFFASSGSLQDILLDNLQHGEGIPP
ncbi:hypothetical protein BGZ49_004687 [Haplosporangium sp. Z 27]|nr:hypothetical protein BGZ49_004687 [Haplosporangium sp. Z 27]